MMKLCIVVQTTVGQSSSVEGYRAYEHFRLSARSLERAYLFPLCPAGIIQPWPRSSNTWTHPDFEIFMVQNLRSKLLASVLYGIVLMLWVRDAYMCRGLMILLQGTYSHL